MAGRSHLSLLLLALCLLSASAAVFNSIDCGSSDLVYTDENAIIWNGDNPLFPNGISQTAQTTSSSGSHVTDTLRFFTSRKKNCYSFEVDQDEQVLVRASFYYGNYDNKNSPPSFDLQFDGNDWARVQTSVDQVSYYEVIYVVKRTVTSICLAQTESDQFPFISALEIRSLPSTFYGHADAKYALFLKRRVAYGSNETIRYTDDPYDRIWSPMPGATGLIPVTSDAPAISDNGGDEPPEAVLRNAITTANTQSIQLGTGFPTFEVSVYINMYFSEVTQLSSTDKRSFMVFNGNTSISSAILPPYGDFKEIYIGMRASSGTILTLGSTSDSTLPPLINGMEVFFVSDVLTNGTNADDLNGLAAFQNTFTPLQYWSGDPCLPAPSTWDWLNCSSEARPRITALYLSGFDLLGPLPDFSSMTSLEIIHLQSNSLNGQIPDFLGTFPNLKELNLADNQFSGNIPASLSNKNGLKLVVTGNKFLCSSGSSCPSGSSPSSGGGDLTSGDDGSGNGGSYRRRKKKKKSNKLPIILGTTIPGFLFIWAVVGIVAIVNYNKQKAAAAVAVNAGQPGLGLGNSSPMPLLNPEMAGNVGQVATLP